MRHLISLKEQSKDDLLTMLESAQEIKGLRNDIFSQNRSLPKYLPDQTLIMLFQKTSTRTRLSFEAAMTELGGHAIFLDPRTSQFSLTKFGPEIQAVMRYGSVLMFRSLQAAFVEQAASYNQIPVIDACSEKYHPAQALSDILTMAEHSGGIDQVKKIAWLGIENNVSNTLTLACAKLGIQVYIVAPKVDPASVDRELNAMAEETGLVTRTLDLAEALDGVDYVHTDTWMNMECFDGDGGIRSGYQDIYDEAKDVFMPYQLSAELIDRHAPYARIMHCMPCHFGYEITEDAFHHSNSVILDQAENRLHMQKAMLLWLKEKI
jgi:ornithine carbamoyltransferase